MNQTLTRKQFDILSLLAEEKSTLSQRQLGEKTGHSLGTVNRVMQELTELQYHRCRNFRTGTLPCQTCDLHCGGIRKPAGTYYFQYPETIGESAWTAYY